VPVAEGSCWFVGTDRCDALLDPANTATLIAIPEPTETIVPRPIPTGDPNSRVFAIYQLRIRK
jgi:hypothetical protein